jgi:hypothetical protein
MLYILRNYCITILTVSFWFFFLKIKNRKQLTVSDLYPNNRRLVGFTNSINSYLLTVNGRLFNPVFKSSTANFYNCVYVCA